MRKKIEELNTRWDDFIYDSPYAQFHRKWVISLVCMPVFESKEECEKCWREEFNNDEFLKAQFEGENGAGWTPF